MEESTMSNKKTMFIVLFVLLPVVMMTNQLVKREDCSCPDKVQTLLEVAKEVELVCPIPPTKNPYRWRQCTIGLWGNQTNLPNPSIVSQTWLQTPSIVIIETGHYQALGRIINVKYLKERLTLKDSNFNAASRESMEFVQQLDILADTLYIEGVVVFYGVRNVKVYAREIIASKGSEIAFSTPDWVQGFSNTVGVKNNGDGTDGENGKNGVDGPQVDIYCDVITGEFNVSSKAGNGKKGQNGGDGQKGGDAVNKADKYSNWFWCGAANTLQMYGETESHAWNRAVKTCRGRSRSAERGNNGESGKKGGKAGKPGKGGTAGRVTLHYRKLNGQFKAMVCGGIGAEPANNGKGGNGGEGGQGVPGITCSVDQRGILFFCKKRGRRRAPQGATGQKGASGSTNKTKGRDGMVTEASVRFSQTIDPQSKNGFPEDLLLIIKRQAEDLLLADRNDQKGRDALQFIIKMATGRRDVEYIMKDVQTKLAFLGKDGFDIFGKNSLFTPLVKWETIQSDVNVIKEAAGAYENTFNDIMKQVTSNENIKQIATLMKALASKQVDTQKRSLIADRAIVESQKRMYVKAIIEAERRMNNTLIRIYSSLRKAQHVAQSRLNREQFLAVLQGITGFSSAIFESAVSDKPKGPFAFIDTAVSIAQYDANKPCLSSLGAVIQSAKKWLTFGKYRPLNDSNQLNFDKMDVTSVPDIMKANLEMNKQQLTADLVCLLEEATKPRDVARLKAEMESYFVLGAARIDMIAKVMDLDNDIGTHNFDISLLNQTGKAITKLSESQDASITSRLRQTFVENLLGTYRQLERSFMLKIYELHKALGFRTLWNLDDVMGSFRRIASESALGTGRLNGAVELTKVLLRLSKIIQKAESCFSKLRYSKSVQKWSFNNVNNKQMFEEIKNGSTRFDIGVDQICNTCYNARLIKMYIELYGPETQPDSVWDKVRLRVRHLGRAYFRAGDGHIKQYHQPITNFRDLKFDRFKISNATECRKRKEDPNKSEAHFCVEKEDTRLEPMCSHPLNDHSTGGLMLGKEECTSPSGFYELEIPVNKALSCADTKMRDTNCKDLDLTKFTKMNVWTYFIYWSRRYPKDPNDPVCSVQSDFNSGYRRHRKVTHRCAD